MKPIALNNASGSYGARELVGRVLESEQQQRQAWLREMERAQLASWLSHDVVLASGPGRAQGQAVHQESGHAAENEGQVTERAQAPSIAGREFATAAASPPLDRNTADRALGFGPPSAAALPSNRGLAEEAGLPAPRSIDPICPEAVRPAAFQLALSSLARAAIEPTLVSIGAPPALGSTPVGRALAGSTVAAASETVRVHAEWTPDGVRLWIALSAEALPQQERIAQQVCGWMARHGCRVLTLCCNGRDLKAAATDTHAAGLPCGPNAESATLETTWL